MDGWRLMWRAFLNELILRIPLFALIIILTVVAVLIEALR